MIETTLGRIGFHGIYLSADTDAGPIHMIIPWDMTNIFDTTYSIYFLQGAGTIGSNGSALRDCMKIIRDSYDRCVDSADGHWNGCMGLGALGGAVLGSLGCLVKPGVPPSNIKLFFCGTIGLSGGVIVSWKACNSVYALDLAGCNSNWIAGANDCVDQFGQ